MPPKVNPHLVRAWIALQKAEQGSSAYHENFWAFDCLYEMCRDEPDAAWPVVLAVLAEDQSEAVMENLAAGPLEDLLANHPQAMIERVEAEARRNPRFARLLGGVWQNSMPDEVWERVQAVWDRRGWDGTPAE